MNAQNLLEISKTKEGLAGSFKILRMGLFYPFSIGETGKKDQARER